MTAPHVLYGISNCDTVKQARTWLQARGVAYQFCDFKNKKSGMPVAALDRWLAEVGWDALLNRRGTTWRKLDDATQATVVDALTARGVMLAHASVIKRPVVEWSSGEVTVGFSDLLFGQRIPG